MSIDLAEQHGGTFVKCAGGQQVWEFPSMREARAFLADAGDAAAPFNWCPVQQPHGPSTARFPRKPTVTLAN